MGFTAMQWMFTYPINPSYDDICICDFEFVDKLVLLWLFLFVLWVLCQRIVIWKCDGTMFGMIWYMYGMNKIVYDGKFVLIYIFIVFGRIGFIFAIPSIADIIILRWTDGF